LAPIAQRIIVRNKAHPLQAQGAPYQRRSDAGWRPNEDVVNAIADSRPAPDSVERAIARVLDAERAARDDIRRAEGDAAASIEQARAAARAIAERVERRLRRARTTFETRAADEVARLDAAALEAAQLHELTRADLDRVDAAIAALAARLTSPDDL
jgi:SLT domain-containing protein